MMWRVDIAQILVVGVQVGENGLNAH